MLVSPIIPLGIEFYSYANSFFCFGLKTCSLITRAKTVYKSNSFHLLYSVVGFLVLVSSLVSSLLSQVVQAHFTRSPINGIADQEKREQRLRDRERGTINRKDNKNVKSLRFAAFFNLNIVVKS